MKCDICNQIAKSFVSYTISKNKLGFACKKCYKEMKQKGEIK